MLSKGPSLRAVGGVVDIDLYRLLKEFRPNVRLYQIDATVLAGNRDVYSTVTGSGRISSWPGISDVHGRISIDTEHDTVDDLFIKLEDDSEMRLSLQNHDMFWREGSQIQIMIASSDDAAYPVAIHVPKTGERIYLEDQFSNVFPFRKFIRQTMMATLGTTLISLLVAWYALPWLIDDDGLGVLLGFFMTFPALVFGLGGPAVVAHYRLYKELKQVSFLAPKPF